MRMCWQARCARHGSSAWRTMQRKRAGKNEECRIEHTPHFPARFRPLSERSLVQSHEFAPGTLGVGLVVDWHAVLLGHVRNAPAMLGCGIYFDLRRNLRGRK